MTKDEIKITRRRKARTSALGYLHEIMTDLHSVGAISDEAMRQIDEGCLAPEEPEEEEKDEESLAEAKTPQSKA